MSQAPSVAPAALADADRALPAASDKDAVSLRGTSRGLEISIVGSPPVSVVAARLTELLAEAPSFFAGCDARVAFDGPLPSGALGCLEEVATRFALTIIEVAPMAARRPQPSVVPTRRPVEARRPRLADGTGPIIDDAVPSDDATSRALPSLPLLSAGAVASPAAAVPVVAPARELVADPAADADAHASPEAAPIEVALANTAPYEAVMINDSTNDGSVTQPRSVGAQEPRVDVPPGEPTHADRGPAAPDEANAAVASAPPPSAELEAMRNAAIPSAAIRSALIPGMLATIPAISVAPSITAPTLGAQASAPAIPVPPGALSVQASALAVPVPPMPALSPQASAPAIPVPPTMPALSPQASAPAIPVPPSAPAPARIEAPASPSFAADAVASGATAMAVELAAAVPPGARLVVGPVRSGVIVDHAGHVIIIGDVNPGAEVRAEGSIIVLGRLRGVAHAVIGRAAGFIIALSLQPQQLRIGRMVARAADADRPGGGAEIAYANGETIVVERFLGRLPSGLAASM